MIGYISVLLILFGISFFVLFVYSLFIQRNNNLSMIFSFLCLAVSIYITAYGFELRSDSLDEIKFFLKLEYFGIPFISAFWILIGYKMRYNKRLSERIVILIMIIPWVTLFLSNTNEYHHLFYTDLYTIEVDGYLLADIIRGPWYYVSIIYIYSALLYSLTSFYKVWKKGNSIIKQQAKILFLGLIWPALAVVLYFSGISPHKIDLIPFGLAVSAIFLYVAVFYLGFLDINEIVRDITFMKINEGIIVFDTNNRLIDFNNYSKTIFNWLNDNLIGMDVSSNEDMKNILIQEDDTFELNIANNYINKIYEFRKTILNEKNNMIGSVYFIRDITKQKELLNNLNDYANYDSLTKIYNRRRLIEEAEKEFLRFKRKGTYFSILMVDIDKFKKVNDKYGHMAGDEVLKTIANLFMERVRRTDIVGRLGGEEFLIILPDTNSEASYEIAEEIRNLVDEMTIEFDNKSIHITISIGIKTASIEEEELSVEKMIHHADLALYNAKNSGRNKTCIYNYKLDLRVRDEKMEVNVK